MLKNDTLKNGTSRIGLYGSAPPGGGGGGMWFHCNCFVRNFLAFITKLFDCKLVNNK